MASQDYYNAPPPQQQPQYQQNYQMEAPNYPPPQSQNGNYSQAPPQYTNMPGYGGAPPPTDGKNTFDAAFKVDKPKYHDIWAGVLLIIVFAGFCAVSGLALNGYDQFFTGGGIYNNKEQFGLNTNSMVLFAFVLVFAFVVSWLYVTLARLFTKVFIWVTGILNICFMLGTAIYMLYRKYYSGGIVFLLFAVLSVVFFISWIPRIPFSVLMLQTSIDVSKKYGHVYLVSILGGLVATAFGAWYSMTLVAIYAKYEPGDVGNSRGNPACANGGGGCGSGKVIGLVAFITFAMYWISEWLKNTIHVTISGVYGSWFFMGGTSKNFPKGATRGAFKRAITYSFGSISLGSLIVAIINCLRQLCSIAQQQASQGGNPIGAACLCCLGCIIGLLDWAVQFVNRYAFSHIALYGKSYFGAAKDTWKLIKDRGIDALINECLVGPVFSMGATGIGILCGLLGYLYIVFTDPGYNSTGGFTPVVVAFSFLIGSQIANIFTVPLGSGMDTLFVAMAWDPEVLMREHPDLYDRMVHVYPHVQQAIHA